MWCVFIKLLFLNFFSFFFFSSQFLILQFFFRYFSSAVSNFIVELQLSFLYFLCIYSCFLLYLRRPSIFCCCLKYYFRCARMRLPKINCSYKQNCSFPYLEKILLIRCNDLNVSVISQFYYQDLLSVLFFFSCPYVAFGHVAMCIFYLFKKIILLLFLSLWFLFLFLLF